MLDSKEALTAGLYSAISGIDYSALSAVGASSVPVYDQVPERSTFPYVYIGDIDEEELNTDTEEGSELTANIEVWTRYKGTRQASQIAGAIKATIHRQSLAVTDWLHVYTEFESATPALDPDGVTRQLTLQYRVYLDQT